MEKTQIKRNKAPPGFPSPPPPRIRSPGTVKAPKRPRAQEASDSPPPVPQLQQPAQVHQQAHGLSRDETSSSYSHSSSSSDDTNSTAVCPQVHKQAKKQLTAGKAAHNGMLCANPVCPFLVNSCPSHRPWCCRKCEWRHNTGCRSRNARHGPECEKKWGDQGCTRANPQASANPISTSKAAEDRAPSSDGPCVSGL